MTYVRGDADPPDPTDGHDRLLADLWHRDQIRAALLRYCRGVDRLDLDLIRSAYHHDAFDDHGVFSGTVDELVDWVADRHRHVERSMHFLGNCLIERRGSTALVETYATVMQRVGALATSTRRRFVDASVDTGAAIDVMTWVRYVDRFRLLESRWAIAHRQVVLEAARWAYVSSEDPIETLWAARSERDGSDPLWTARFEAGFG